jgi:hypothetical protein
MSLLSFYFAADASNSSGTDLVFESIENSGFGATPGVDLGQEGKRKVWCSEPQVKRTSAGRRGGEAENGPLKHRGESPWRGALGHAPVY